MAQFSGLRSLQVSHDFLIQGDFLPECSIFLLQVCILIFQAIALLLKHLLFNLLFIVQLSLISFLMLIILKIRFYSKIDFPMVFL